MVSEVMLDSSIDNYSSQGGYKGFAGNKIISFSVIISCVIFLLVIIGEKSKFFAKMIPTLRGEVKLANKVVVTSISQHFPIIIRKNDPFIGQQLRYTGGVKSLFSDVAIGLCQKKDTVVEIGAHYGVNTIIMGDFLRRNGKPYRAHFCLYQL